MTAAILAVVVFLGSWAGGFLIGRGVGEETAYDRVLGVLLRAQARGEIDGPTARDLVDRLVSR